MKLKDIMTTQVEVVRPDTSIVEAAGKMRSQDVGSLPVVEGQRLVGVITDRDITIRVTAEGRDPKSTTVRECLSPDPASAFEDQDVDDAVQLMQQKQIRRLPVLNRDQQLVGIVALADLAAEGSKKDVARTVREVSKPS
ncbi:MAG: CBS domain-containing protein [Verrucomicrobia bacterium]|nr:CBS domain-containing protein [Verrucomicrobiota bacterium]